MGTINGSLRTSARRRRIGVLLPAALLPVALGCSAASSVTTPPADAAASDTGAAPLDASPDAEDGASSDASTTPDATDGATDAAAEGAADSALDAPEAGDPCATITTPGGGGVFDVTTYGAVPNGPDAYAAIQAAITASCALPTPAPVFLPLGRYVTSQPLRINCGLEMYGACRSGSVLVPQFGGPAILMDPAVDVNVKLAPALVGTGNSLDTESGHYYLNLRDMPSVELDGLAAFTAEAFIEQTAPYTQGYAGIVGGPTICQTAAGTCPGAFQLGVGIQDLRGYLGVGGTSYELDGPTITLGVPHHVAITYDGATIRLFLDGAIVASKAATGTVTQDPTEDVTIGPVYYPLEYATINQALPGFIDSVRLSNVARYTAAFTVPTAKLASDASTLALTNFDTQAQGMTQAQSKDGPFWLPVRRSQDASGNGLPFLGGVTLHNFTVEGGMGIVGWLSVTSRITQVDCVGCDYGFAMLGNNYASDLDDVSATAGAGRGRFGINAHSPNGNGYHDVRLAGQTLPFVAVGGAQQVHTNLTIAAGPATSTAVTLMASDDVFDGLTVDATNAGAGWRGAISAFSPWAKLHLQRGTIGNAGSGIPIAMWGGGAAGALVEGTSFTGTAGAPEILHVATPTVHPNIVLAAIKDSNVSWSDDTGLVLAPGPDPAAVPDPATLPASDPGPAVVLGQVPASRVFDVTKYGAVSGGANDSTAGIQAAIDAACVQGGTVFFPVGEFWMSHPALVQCPGLTIEGAGRYASVIRSYTDTAAFILDPPGMTGIHIAGALVGTGNAMQTDGSSAWLELRDADSVELDGLTAFSVEAFIQMDAASSGYGGIVQSHGCLGTSASMPGCTSAFSLATNGQTLTGSMSIGGASYSLQGPTLSLGAVHHVALSYDGAAVRLFLDGAIVASEAATGVVNQLQHEDVTLGPRTVGFDAVVQDPAMNGVIDSIRISKIARYTTAFTVPTAKPNQDAGSLLTLTFDDNEYNAVHAVGGGTVWLPVRRTAEPNGTAEGSLTGFTLRSLTVGSMLGLVGTNVVGGRYLDSVIGSDCALLLQGNSAGSLFDGLKIPTGGRGRYGLLTVNGDDSVHHDLMISYAKIPLAVYGGQRQQFVHVLLTPDPATSVYGAYFVHSGDSALGLYFDNESAMPAFKGDIVVVDPTATFQLLKGEIDIVSPGAPITLDGPNGIVLEGASFGGSSAATALVNVASPTNPAVAIGITADPGVNLSNDSSFQSIGN